MSWARLSCAVVAVALLSGCGAGVGTIDVPDKAEHILDAALEEFESRPMLAFSGTIADFNGSGAAEEVAVDVSSSGVAYGSAKLGKSKIGLMIADGVYYVKADKKHWKDLASKSTAGKLDGEWAPANPESWFDVAGRLTPKEYAKDLRAALKAAHSFDSWAPKPVEVGGRSCHPFTVNDGRVCVTSAKPYRIVSVKQVAPHKLTDSALSVDVDVDGGRAKKLRDKVTDAVGDLKKVDAVGAVSLSVSSDNFSCAGATCTFAASVGADVPKSMRVDDKVKVGFEGVADAGSAGEKKCVASATVKVGESKMASCTVSFDLAAGSSAQVSSEWRSRDLLTFSPDTGDIKDKVKADMKDIVD